MKRKVMKNKVSNILISTISLIVGIVFAEISYLLFDMSLPSLVIGGVAGWFLVLYIIEYLENK